MVKKKILIIDDEEATAKLARLNLENTGKYEVHIETEGANAITVVGKKKPDLILLDLMMPNVGGYEICEKLKKSPRYRSIPIIVMSGRRDEADKVSSLDMGADDYIVKPVMWNELDARIGAVLRRSVAGGNSKAVVDIAGVVSIDPEKHEVAVKGIKVDLTSAEFMILELLASRQGRVFTRSEILDYLWGEEKYVIDRTVDVHVKHLRGKLGEAAKFIKNVRGVGYKIGEGD